MSSDLVLDPAVPFNASLADFVEAVSCNVLSGCIEPSDFRYLVSFYLHFYSDCSFAIG